MTTAAKTDARNILAILASDDTPGGASFERLASRLAALQGRGSGGGAELRQALLELTANGEIKRSKGPRGENLYTLPQASDEAELERLRREKTELQQALAILIGAAHMTLAQGDPRDRSHDTLKELANASSGARETLERIR